MAIAPIATNAPTTINRRRDRRGGTSSASAVIGWRSSVDKPPVSHPAGYPPMPPADGICDLQAAIADCS
jgi:hypothetical protein